MRNKNDSLSRVCMCIYIYLEFLTSELRTQAIYCFWLPSKNSTKPARDKECIKNLLVLNKGTQFLVCT